MQDGTRQKEFTLSVHVRAWWKYYAWNASVIWQSLQFYESGKQCGYNFYIWQKHAEEIWGDTGSNQDSGNSGQKSLLQPNLLTEKSSKQQEVQNLVASTSDKMSILCKPDPVQVQEKSAALMAQVNSADSSISQLMEGLNRKKLLKLQQQKQQPLRATQKLHRMKIQMKKQMKKQM